MKYRIFFLIFVAVIINSNVYSENTYLKYSPKGDASYRAEKSVIGVDDNPSLIGLSFSKMKKYHYLYKITNLINNKIYIGIHATDNLNDGYFGSGHFLRKAIKKYGKKNFVKEILEYFSSYIELNNREREIVNIDFVKRHDTYNTEIGGKGGKYWTDDDKNNMSEIKKGSIPWNKDLKDCHSEESRRKISENRKVKPVGELNPMYGKKVKDFMSPEDHKNMCLNISKGNTGKVRTKEHKKNYSNYAKNRIWLVNKDGILKHGTINDERLKTGEWQTGKKWKE